MKPPSAKKENASALTGRTLDEIAHDTDAQWHSNRTSIPGLDLDALPRSELKFIEPMLARPIGALPEGADWQYEIKLGWLQGAGDQGQGVSPPAFTPEQCHERQVSRDRGRCRKP